MGQIFIADGAPPSATFVSHNNASGGTSFSFASMALGSESADRWIVALIGYQSSLATNVSSVTIAGVAATRLDKITQAGSTGMFVYAAPVPTGTTGTIAFSTDAAAFGTVSVYAVTGWAGSSFVFGSSTGKPTSMSVNQPAYSAVVAGAIGVDNFTTDPNFSAAWTGLTEDVDQPTGTGSFIVYTAASANNSAANSPLNVTCTMNHTGTGESAAVVALYN